MHYPWLSRSTAGAILIIFFIVFPLTYRAVYDSKLNRVNALAHPESTWWCNIWENSTLWQDPVSFEACHSSTNIPQVGDRSIFGNPQECIRAASRFDHYHSSLGRDWAEIKWGDVQSKCASMASVSASHEPVHRRSHLHPDSENGGDISRKAEGKVAIVLRTWDDYDYTENRRAWLRALIAEAALQRHNAYRVFFLVNVKDHDIHLEKDSVAYNQMMRRYVPAEFRDMAFLFNEQTLKAWYPKIPEHGAQDQMYQALQIFSHQFPEYDYIWQLEMDLRMTGHVYDTLLSATVFAREQSRHDLWERNGRFYIPALHNSSYENFTETVDAEIGDTGIWGPVTTTDFKPQGPQPPPRFQTDWGIGEEADLINFMPMIDPRGTNWVYEHDIHGFADKDATPRRLSVVSISRTSRRLLQLVNDAQWQHGQWLVSEATMETFALLHGLKAVTVPHPIVFGDPMTAEELDASLHKGPPSNKAGGERPSILYTNEGWVDGPWGGSSYWFAGGGAQNLWDAYVGGEGVPPMLLHPVKEK